MIRRFAAATLVLALTLGLPLTLGVSHADDEKPTPAVDEDAVPLEIAEVEEPVEEPVEADPFAGTGPLSGWKRGRAAIGDHGCTVRRVRAVHDALDWLARHQEPDGSWSGSGFVEHCRSTHCRGQGNSHHDVGLTGLSLLCFLGAGEPQATGVHGDAVRRGLASLTVQQDAEGCFGPRNDKRFLYSHMIATLAMVEAYGLTGHDDYRRPAQNGMAFLIDQQVPYLAWGYRHADDGMMDTSVTAWALLLVSVAREAGLDVERSVARGGLAWIDKMIDSENGRVGYVNRGGESRRLPGTSRAFPEGKTLALTGAGVMSKLGMRGSDAKDETVKKSVALIATLPPTWNPDDGSIDLYGWHWSSLAMFQAGDKAWKPWNRALRTALLDHQGGDGWSCEKGSWVVDDPWSGVGGRVYTTSMACLALMAHARYPRFHKLKDR